MKSRFDELYNKIISEAWAFSGDRNKETGKTEEEEYEEQRKKWREKNEAWKKIVDASKKSKADLANVTAQCKTMKTKELQDFIIKAVGVKIDSIPSVAMDEYLKRDDADLSFLEQIFFDTDDLFKKSSMTTGKLKRQILVNDPEARVKSKIIGHEYSLEKLKNMITSLEETNHYHLFDSNYGSSTVWCDIMVEFMRQGHYFTGKWPNETYAEQ